MAISSFTILVICPLIILEPSEFELVGKIHVTGTKGDGLPYTYGDNTAELYRWKWSYVK